ncbi:MAG: NAD(P)H-quinone oxidoreductase [Actinomycetota bacterium]|nr:NAD(P)H-quinone oxidoreductase [Actinomycetota bacterium]MDP2287495.1 NAD(P)H-quinone oxidoreductase [Actinomycetota bacterium]
MLAITQPSGPGGPESLELTQVPDPELGPGEVRLAVAAAGVNRADLLQRQGMYDPPPGTSAIIGLECSGVISELGPGVTRFTVGDEVVALLAGGGYAEQVIVPVGQVLPLPPGVTLMEGAGLPEVACTVWSNVFMTAGLQQGQWLLIHGGGSGIGTMAIQLAKAFGARIAVTAGSQDKLEACADLGADLMINYKEQDFLEAIRAEIGGVDVILDLMGAKYLASNVRALNRNGRLAIIGLQGGVKAELNLSEVLRKNATIHATSLRGRPLNEKTGICEQVGAVVWPWIHAGLVKPVIGAQLHISQAAQAHRMLEAGEVTGKIVLAIDGAAAE